MKKVLVVAGLGAAVAVSSLLGAGPASADSYQDSQYVACVAVDGLFSYSGPSAQAAFGRQIAGHIASGLRDPLQEREGSTGTRPARSTWASSNYLVNCATDIYLGFGPAHGTADGEYVDYS